jgi:hypothetical protein
MPSVLFIGGHNRSGSTLLSRLLGRHPAVVSVGELTFIATRGWRDNQLCSCGKRFRECEFWASVVSESAGPDPERWFARLADLTERVGRIRYIPLLAYTRRNGDSALLTAMSAEYAAMLEQVLLGVARTADVDTVIDSSKHPPYGFFLAHCKGIDLYPVHLIRDSRAVAFSQRRKRVRPEIYWKTELMPQLSPTQTAFDWTLFNSFMQMLGSATGRYRRVRYEDIAVNPTQVSSELLEWLGLDGRLMLDVPVSQNGSGAQNDSGEHHLSGNPMRFQSDFKVSPDMEWLTSMSRRDKAVTSLLSAPLLVKYGYKILAQPAAEGIGSAGSTL